LTVKRGKDDTEYDQVKVAVSTTLLYHIFLHTLNRISVLDNCRQEVNRIDIGQTDLILHTPSYVSGGGGRCIIDSLIADYQTRPKRPPELACIKVQY
jgi:hypothetical protein